MLHMKLTKDQLVATLSAIKGSTFMTLETNTVPEMRKTGNPFVGRVKKHTKINVTFGANYENAVNRQAEREENENAGEFKSLKLAYGKWLVPHKLIEHKGAVQVRVMCNPHMKPEVAYSLDGHPVNPSEMEAIKAFMPEKKTSARQEEFGIEREVVPRNYSLDSIEAVTVNGTRYEIVG